MRFVYLQNNDYHDSGCSFKSGKKKGKVKNFCVLVRVAENIELISFSSCFIYMASI